MDWVGISLFGYSSKEAARRFNKPADLQSILNSISVSEEQFEEVRKEVAQKDTAGLKVTAQTSGSPELYDPIITYLTWMILHDAAKTKKEKPAYPTRQEYDFFHDALVEGKAEDLKKIVGNDNVPRNQLQQYIQKFQSSSKDENKLSKEDLKVLNNQKVVVDAGGGWNWINLVDDKGYIKGGSPVLTKILGHCGNGEGIPGDKMYLLSKKVMGLIPSIKATVIVDSEGNIRESKASFNKKIDINKYGGAFLKLLDQPFVKGLDDEGAYQADANLHMSDFYGTPFEEQAKSLIEKKPRLMDNSYDQTVSKYKGELEGLSPNEKKEELLSLIKEKKISLVHARALNGGTFPFNEDEFIQLIKDGLSIHKIVESDTKLLTPKVQKVLAYKEPSENISVMIYMAATLNNHPIQKSILIEGINSAEYFYLEDYLGAVGGNAKQALSKYLLENKDLLEVIFKTDPTIIKYFPEDKRMDIFDTKGFPDALREGFKRHPNAIGYFPKDKRMDIFNTEGFPDAFREVFKKNLNAMYYFPEESRIDIYRKMPEIFLEKMHQLQSSELLNLFPDKYHDEIMKDVEETRPPRTKRVLRKKLQEVQSNLSRVYRVIQKHQNNN